MIVGAVSSLFEPQISLTVLSRGGNPIAIDATIDTGFNGYLSLNRSLISSLEIPFLARRQGTLADGSSHRFRAYAAEIEWAGTRSWIEIDCLDGGPLVGTQLLRRHRLRIDFVSRGAVEIERLA